MYIDVVVNENDLDEDVSVLICDYKVQGRGKMHRHRFNNLAVEEIGRVTRDFRSKVEVKYADRGPIA